MNKQGICSSCGEDEDYLDEFNVCARCREEIEGDGDEGDFLE